MERWKLSLHRTNPDQFRRVENLEIPELEEGQVELAVRRFGLTANNITYAMLGDSFAALIPGGGYFSFFPGAPDEGILPVWGFAEITRSRVADVGVGQRVYGYLPFASHLVVTPASVGPSGFVDASAHRAPLPAPYNRYETVQEGDASAEGLRCALSPLAGTGFLLADAIAESDAPRTEQLVVTSASSKTALFFASAYQGMNGVPVHGLTSAPNLSFVRDTGLYTSVMDYDALEDLPRKASTLVDIAGNPSVAARLFTHLDEGLHAHVIVGQTHWGADRAPNPKHVRPTPFFAPTQITKRLADWGPAELKRRIDAAWGRFLDAPFVTLEVHTGSSAAVGAYQRLVAGKTSPQVAVVCNV